MEYLSDNIATYRQSLMGMGILGVLTIHLYYMGYLPNYISAFLKESSMFVYTEGFFFLSGFGLYCSFSKNGNLYDFYVKRIKRLLIPYILLMSPYIIVTSIIDMDSWYLIVARVFGLSFWIEGNYCSMWFIHVLLLLYFIYPLFHRIIFITKYKIFCFSSLFFCYGIFVFGLAKFTSVFSMYSFALYRIPFFFMGACVSWAYQKKDDVVWLMIWIVSYLAISVSNLLVGIESMSSIYKMAFYLPLMGISIDIMQRHGFYKSIKLLNWFGKYTLEIYILHLLFMYIFIRLGYNIRIAIIAGEILAVVLCPFVQTIMNVVISIRCKPNGNG